MPEIPRIKNVDITQVCSERCFGDSIKMDRREEKCLKTCFQQYRNNASPMNDKAKKFNVIF